MTIHEIMYDQSYVETRRGLSLHELDILIANLLDKPKEFIYAHPEYKLRQSQITRLKKHIQRRKAGEPIAYITGHKEFYDLDFIVTSDVLIPRPDTELLVECVVNYAKKNKLTIADIGTGSGNIAVAVKKTLRSRCRMIATDISATALHIARKNAKHHNTAVTFYKSNVLRKLPSSLHTKLDIIMCNAPYLTKTEAHKKNLQYEPQVALTPTDSPTSIIQQLLQQTPRFLKPDGVIFLEIGHRQANQVKKLCRTYFPHSQIKVHKDLGNFDRVIECQVKSY